MAGRISGRADKVMPRPRCVSDLQLSSFVLWSAWPDDLPVSGAHLHLPGLCFPQDFFMGNLRGLWPTAHAYILNSKCQRQHTVILSEGERKLVIFVGKFLLIQCLLEAL